MADTGSNSDIYQGSKWVGGGRREWTARPMLYTRELTQPHHSDTRLRLSLIFFSPTVAGISGNEEDGAWSVALSGGYPDESVGLQQILRLWG